MESYLKGFKSDNLYLIGPFAQNAKYQEPVLFIDAGVKYRKKAMGISIGDGDSSSPQQMDILLPERKNESDLEAAFRLLPQFYKHYFMQGFLGGRRDQEWLSIFSGFEYFQQHQISACAHFDSEVLLLSNAKHCMEHQGVFSILCLGKQDHLRVHGEVEYAIYNNLKSFSSHGLSNIAYGKVNIEVQGQILIFRN